jgi:hypothetical protein
MNLVDIALLKEPSTSNTSLPLIAIDTLKALLAGEKNSQQ